MTGTKTGVQSMESRRDGWSGKRWEGRRFTDARALGLDTGLANAQP
jgi:hypothetical protein